MLPFRSLCGESGDTPSVASVPERSADSVNSLSEDTLWCLRFLRQGAARSAERRPDLCSALTVGDSVYHLVQDKDELEKIFAEELPPDEYYNQLGKVLHRKFLSADPKLLEHAVPLVAVFDTAVAFALSFGIAKFQLAQTKVKLVGEYVGREGRSPNLEIIRAIRNWPPINTLKDLQASWVRLTTCEHTQGQLIVVTRLPCVPC